MRTFLWCLEDRFWTPASSSSSSSSGSWRRTGSCSSAGCSPMSPVSVHEDSEPEDRRRWFGSSCWRNASSEADWESGSVPERAGRVRKGMLEGRREELVGGILGGLGAVKQQRPPVRA